MVDIDLRSLSAPLEALRPEVAAAYQRLDGKWEEIAKQLASLPIPCTIGVTYSENPSDPCEYKRLEWRKYNGNRRLCIVHINETYEEHSVTAYEEWSAEQRMELLQYVPKLFEEGVQQVKKFIQNTISTEVKK